MGMENTGGDPTALENGTTAALENGATEHMNSSSAQENGTTEHVNSSSARENGTTANVNSPSARTNSSSSQADDFATLRVDDFATLRVDDFATLRVDGFATLRVDGFATAQLKELLNPIDPSKKNDEYIAMESRTFAKDVWLHFCANRWALAGVFLLAVIVLFAIFGGLLSPYPVDAHNAAARNLPPGAAHWFGTDKFGRDIFTRAMYGARISLFIGIASTAICAVVGTVYGGASGYLGGAADLILMRFCDVLYAIPSLLYVILIMLIFGSNVKSILIGICVAGWVGVARIVRAQVMALKNREYALASYVLGASHKRIFFKHILPNSMGPILVTLTLMIPQTIFMEAFLSFIGIGISAPQASLGTLAQEAKPYFQIYPSQILFPVALICLIIFALTFISKGLEEALDPKSRR